MLQLFRFAFKVFLYLLKGFHCFPSGQCVLSTSAGVDDQTLNAGEAVLLQDLELDTLSCHLM